MDGRKCPIPTRGLSVKRSPKMQKGRFKNQPKCMKRNGGEVGSDASLLWFNTHLFQECFVGIVVLHHFLF